MKRFLLGIFICFPFSLSTAQSPNWQNKDLVADSVFGISTDKAYKELLSSKKSTSVLVAVIDCGIDTAHEDLKPSIWINPHKLLSNRKDAEKDGYINDIHGWSFIGGKKGDVEFDNLEVTRLMRQDQAYFDSLSYAGVPSTVQPQYQKFRKWEKRYIDQLKNAEAMVDRVGKIKMILDSIMEMTRSSTVTVKDLQSYTTHGKAEKELIVGLSSQLSSDPDYPRFYKLVCDTYTHFEEQVKYSLNMTYDSRAIVGDDYNNIVESNYGNNNVCGPDAVHGTHVSGIIAATRNNGIGINGIADNVKIMCIRVVPTGDERDKDVANGIRYAVNNGAKIINMSFGKPLSPYKRAVDDAVKYAMARGVLIIHAAGNDGKDLENPENAFYPSRDYADSSGQANAWIEVGASGFKDDSTLCANFSNYGKTKVDVFAPGVSIYSTTPNSSYAYFDGTSMAAPTVTGLASIIMEYFPRLSAAEVKQIILRSVYKVNHNVILRNDNGAFVSVPFSQVCITGGIVNAFKALKLAQAITR
ncbi:MAG TPA: S8 family serine peptidase [Puia sp.]|nr:S8 family serine peptidase [Puia sp.]